MTTPAVADIWQLYEERLRRYLLRKVDAEYVPDLMQVIAEKAIQNLDMLQQAEHASAWLYRVAHNVVVDHYRKQRHRTAELSDEIVSDNAHDDSERQRLIDCVLPFIHELPSPYREALEAVEMRSVSQKELASELGLSYSALKSRVQRGRVMLAELFDKCCTFERDHRGVVVGYTKNTK